MEILFQLGMVLLAALLYGHVATVLVARYALARWLAALWVFGVVLAFLLEFGLLRKSDPLSRYKQYGSWFLILETLLSFGVPTAAANCALLFFKHTGPFHDDLRALRYLSALGFLLLAVPTLFVHTHIMECIFGVDGMGEARVPW